MVKKQYTATISEESEKNVSLTTLQSLKSMTEDREEVLQALRQIPLQPIGKTTVIWVVFLEPTEDHVRAGISTTASEEKPTLELIPGRTSDPTGYPQRSSLFLKDCTS